eukprot:TRINITY_DN90760_c0_g1_i1.p2 TRINITY_DN90760_c0_g1~~TRINITY_DN90760_c0_g1_i1.p2  ORF type:complete len:199 (-),score=21.14 TRINITY_DN90760_c0_g1_i1:213-809(-)
MTDGSEVGVDMTGEWVSARQAAIDLAIHLGVEPERAASWIEVNIKTMRGKKKNDELTRDPVTGQLFDSTGLMDQLEREGKDPGGVEFYRRRGYTLEERTDFLSRLELIDRIIEAAPREAADELMWLAVCFCRAIAHAENMMEKDRNDSIELKDPMHPTIKVCATHSGWMPSVSSPDYAMLLHLPDPQPTGQHVSQRVR